MKPAGNYILLHFYIQCCMVVLSLQELGSAELSVSNTNQGIILSREPIACTCCNTVLTRTSNVPSGLYSHYTPLQTFQKWWVVTWLQWLKLSVEIWPTFQTNSLRVASSLKLLPVMSSLNWGSVMATNTASYSALSDRTTTYPWKNQFGLTSLLAFSPVKLRTLTLPLYWEKKHSPKVRLYCCILLS